MRGIYKITINDIVYIGKDFRIDLNKRLKAHLNLPKKDLHYNIDKSSISRIRSGKIYKEFHKIYNRVQRPVSLFAGKQKA